MGLIKKIAIALLWFYYGVCWFHNKMYLILENIYRFIADCFEHSRSIDIEHMEWVKKTVEKLKK